MQGAASRANYLVGAGVYDITGPAAEIVMMGFAVPSQKTSGIHMRLRARAFVIGDGARRVVFVSADLGMLFQMVKLKVCEKISADAELAPHYDERNVLLSATHTHGGPGGYSGYLLYDFTIKGFIHKHFEAIVDGIYRAIRRAHHNLEPGQILIAEGVLDGAAGNRALEPYDSNPAAERALYDGPTDRTFTLLKFVSEDGRELGMLNWFAVHPDSIGPDNTLITGDNKGWASYLFERDHGTDYRADKTFVAAFAQANAGDVSPNVGFGQAPPEVDPGRNPSLRNAVTKQYEKARELYARAAEPLTGAVDFRHEWVDLRSLYVESAGTTTAASGMGAAFTAGSPLDNPSPLPLFANGTTVASLALPINLRARLISGFFQRLFALLWPSSSGPAYRAGHGEKPVLIPTGVAHLNVRGPVFTPQIMPVQVLQIGSLAIVAVPSEVTTMAGRRLKRTVVEGLEAVGVTRAVIASLANSYSSYLATREEYACQWYEGASTPFGPHQLAGFQQEFAKLCRAMVRGEEEPPGPRPSDVTSRTVDFTPKVWFDATPPGKRFGEVSRAPAPRYLRGEVVEARFWGGHPNNDYRTQDTFLAVEKLVNGAFVEVADDGAPETIFRWRRRAIACSEITICWDTRNASPGTYRIRHKGNRKQVWTRAILPYEGVTNVFVLEDSPQETARA